MLAIKREAIDDEHLVGVVALLSCLGLVEASGTDIALNEMGKRIAAAGMAERRRLASAAPIQIEAAPLKSATCCAIH